MASDISSQYLATSSWVMGFSSFILKPNIPILTYNNLEGGERLLGVFVAKYQKQMIRLRSSTTNAY